MIQKEEVKKAIEILSIQINNNKDLWGQGNTEFRLLATSQGNLKVLLQKLEK